MIQSSIRAAFRFLCIASTSLPFFLPPLYIFETDHRQRQNDSPAQQNQNTCSFHHCRSGSLRKLLRVVIHHRVIRTVSIQIQPIPSVHILLQESSSCRMIEPCTQVILSSDLVIFPYMHILHFHYQNLIFLQLKEHYITLHRQVCYLLNQM